MNFEDEVREEACAYIGREITDAEWKYALPLAKNKLDQIIAREGDFYGERRKSYYLGKLVQEIISQRIFSQCTIKQIQEIMKQRSIKNNEVAKAYA